MGYTKKRLLKPSEYVVRILMVLATFVRLLLPTSYVFAASLSFSDWGADIADVTQYDTENNAAVTSGVISALDAADSFLITYQVDVSSISSGIDGGEAELSYAFDCDITNEGEDQNDTGALVVEFTGGGSNQSHSCDVGNQGTFSNSLFIPDGTTSIEFTFTSTLVGETNTVAFSNLSIVIDDETAPTLELVSTPEAGVGAVVSMEVGEAGSGLSGVYYAAGSHTAEEFPGIGTEVEITYGYGTFTVASGGTYTVYAADYNGNETIDTINVNTYPSISGLNDQTTQEDTTLAFNFNVSDAETAAGSLTVNAASSNQSIIEDGSIGLSNVDGLVSVTVNPVANANGSAAINFTVTDAQGLSISQVSNIEVQAVNDTPTANADSVETSEDTAIEIAVLANDTNPDQGILSVSILTDPANGLAVANASGTVTYTPNNNYAGSDTFTYQITDSVGGDTASTDVSVTVTAVDDAPTAVDDSAEVAEDDSVTFTVLGNDSDVENDAFSIVSYTEPEHGSVTFDSGASSFTYSPTADYFGTDAFSYTIQETINPEATATAWVYLTITGVNDAPEVAYDASVTTDEDTPVTRSITASDVDGDTLYYSVKTGSEPVNGSLELDGNSYTYTPSADFYGTDNFTIEVDDGTTTVDCAITVTINAVNDAPVPSYAASISTDEDVATTQTITVTDTENDTINYSVKAGSEPANGSIAFDGNNYTYTPAADFEGTDSFTIVVSDVANDVDCDITVTVNGINDAPVPSYDANVSTDEETAISRTITAIDVDEDELNYAIKTGSEPVHGSLDLVDNTYTYTPDMDYNGTDTFTITVTDGEIPVDCEITVTVNAVNDDPVPTFESSIETDEDTPVTNALTATDADDDTLSYYVKTDNGPANGSLNINESEGEYTYTYSPDENYYGDDSFVIIVFDGTVEVEVPMSVTVQSINDAPVPSYTPSISTNEDTAISQTITATDVENETITYFVKEENQPASGSVVLSGGTYTYTPTADYNGPDSFIVTASDGTNEVDCEITVTVNAVNDDPIPTFTSSFATDEDTPATYALTSTDVDGDTLTYYVKTGNGPANGSLDINESAGEYSYTYSPNENYYGGDSFTVTTFDETVEIDTEVTVTVNSVNDAPVPSYTASVSTDEDTAISRTITTTDVENDTITYSVKEENEPASGSVELSDGTYTYTPNGDFNGTDEFTVTVSDGTDEVDCTITVTVDAVNDAPVPTYDSSIETDEDTSITPSLTATDVDRDDLKYLVKDGNGPANGTLTLISGGYTYDPDQDFNGSDSFTITVSDGTAEVDCPVTVTVNAVNDAPVPTYSASISTDEDNDITENLTATDVDEDDLYYSVKVGNEPAHGSLTLIEGGYTYAPDADFNGTDTFTITVYDGTVEVDCEITVTVNSINDAPVPTYSASISTDEDNAVTKSLTATDVDEDALNFSVETGNEPSHGTLELIDGGYTYTPVANYNGSDTFTITVSDGVADVDCEISVTVNAVNDRPVAAADSATTDEDINVTISVLDNDTDIDSGEGDTLTVSAITVAPSHGSATISGNKVIYDPADNYFGPDSFTYQISDSGSLTATALVTLTVNPVNDNPQPSSLLDEYTTNEDTPITIDFELSDVETPPETLTMQVVSGNTSVVAQNRVTVTGLEDTDPAVSVTINPLSNRNGDVPFTIYASDGFQTASYPFTLHVTPVNDAPTARNDSIGFTEDTVLDITISSQLLNNDTDIDNDSSALSFDGIISTTTHGTLIDNEDGTLTYTPDDNYDGTDSFTYRIADPDNATDTATVTLTAAAINDVPIISEIVDQTIDEDGTLSVNFTVDDFDLETDAELNTLVITTYSTNPDLLDDSNMQVTGSGKDRTFTASPLADKNGSLTVTITVSDGIAEASEDFLLTIRPVPDNPVAEDDLFYIQTSGTFSIDPVANDWDADDDTDLTPTVVIEPTHGTLTPDGDAFTYTAGVTFTETDTFTYYVTDSTGLTSETATVTLSADPENEAPHISTIANQVIYEDNSSSVDFTVEDYDGNLDSVTVESSDTTLFPLENLELTNTGSTYTLAFTPAENEFGTATITVTAVDTELSSASKSFTIRVIPVNDDPTAVTDEVETNEDVAVTFNVLTNDIDPETATGDLIIGEVTSGVSHGRLYGLGDGQFKYDPNDHFNGTDSFTYQVMDEDGGTSEGTVNITITSVNDNPVAYANYLDTVVQSGGTLDNINVIGNDTDPDLAYDPNEEIHVTRITSQPSCGTASVNPDGTVKYEAFEGETGCAAAWMWITYEIEDHYGATDTASISIAVDDEETNLPPRPEGVWRSILEDASTITIDLSSYVFDPDGDTLTYDLDLASPPNTNLGTATISGSVVSYTPGANKNGEYGNETFKYSVSDGHVTVQATIYVRIRAVNDAPTVSIQSDAVVEIPDQDMVEDTTKALDFYIYDVDIEDAGTTFGIDDLALSIYSDNASLVPPSALSYTRNDVTGLISLSITPVADESGTANISVVVSDGIVNTTDTFLLTVEKENDPPIASNHLVSTDEEEPVTIQVVDFQINEDGDVITISLDTEPSNGTVTFDQENGELTYTPDTNYFGSDSFTFVLTDEGDLTDSGDVIVTVNAVNDPPDLYDLAAIVETPEDTSVDIPFYVSDIDTDLADMDLSYTASDDSLINTAAFTKSTDDSGLVTFTIDPTANASGTITIEVTASDGSKSDSESFILKVYAVNDAPVANDDTGDTDEDNAITIDVIANDTDLEDQPSISVVSTTSPKLLSDGTAGHGSVVNNNDGTLTYTPGDDRNEDIFFTYELSDSGNLRDTATVTITINSVNDAPRLTNDNRTIVEDHEVDIAVLANDTDVEGDAFSIASNTDPLHGTLELDVDTQTYTYKPEKDYFGSDSFTYTVEEDEDNSVTATATVKITITGEDDYPIVSTDEPWVIDEDTTESFDVTISDAETASGNLLITFTSLDTNLIKSHNVILQGSGTSRTVQLTPEAEMNGTLQLQVDVNDGSLTTTEYIDIIISPVNDPPQAQDYTAEIDEDGQASGTVVVKSDIDLAHEGDSHTYSLGTDGANGSAVVQPDGDWTYTPNANFNGTDEFTVIITDEGDATAVSTITVTVHKVNDVPQVTSTNAHTIDEDTHVTDTIVVWDPDTEDSTDPDSYTMQVVVDPENGELVFDADTGEYTYTPDANYNGTDSFTIKVEDEHGTGPDKVVNIIVDPVNDPPVAGDDTAEVAEEGSVEIPVLDNDTDIDLDREGDDLTIYDVAGVDNGIVTIDPEDSKSLTFAPNTDFFGTEEFTYTVIDEHGATDVATVTVTVNAVNDPPIISDVADQAIDEDSTTGAISFTVTDVDDDDGGLEVTAVTDNGTVIPLSSIDLGGSGSARTVTVTPVLDKNTWNDETDSHDPVTITLTVSDGELTDSDTFTVTVRPLNDTPEPQDDTATVAEDGSVVIDVLANDDDVDIHNEGDSLTIQSVNGVDNGTVDIADDKLTLTFTPDADYFGTEEFTYTVVDENDATYDATVTVTVTPVNDPPVISDVSNQTIDEDSTTDAISFTVTDVDDDDGGLEVTAMTDNGTVIPLSNIVLGGSGSDRTVTITPVADKNTWNDETDLHDPVKITLMVSDGELTDSEPFTMTVRPLNDTPEPEDDTATVAEDGSIIIDVLDNDEDVDINNEGDSLTIQSVDDVDNATVEIALDGKTLTFTPDADYFGTEEFTYTVVDENGATFEATVTVEVTPVNDPPVISDVSNQTIAEDDTTGAINFTVTDVDNEDGSLVVTAVTDNGTVIPLSNIVLGGSGSARTVTITPVGDKNTWNDETDSHDPVTITLTVSDGGLTDEDSFKVTVTPLNDGPLAVDDTTSMFEDTTRTINVLANDSDVDLDEEGDDLIITGVDGVKNATVNIAADKKSLTFKPDTHWNGVETFTYTIKDEAGETTSASVTATVNATNDAPNAVDDTASVAEDSNVDIDVLANDEDVDLTREGDTLTIVSCSGVDHGSCDLSTDKTYLTFTPETDWNGVETFTYVMKDAEGEEDSAAVTVTVTAVDDDPVANADSYTIDEDVIDALFTVLDNDTDADLDYGDSLQIVQITSDVSHGTLTINGTNNQIYYTPTADYNGTDSFTYQIKDEQDPAVYDSAVVSITINSVNDLPVVTSTNAHTILEDSSASGTVTVSDVDTGDSPDPDSHKFTVDTDALHGSVSLNEDSGAYTYTPDANYNGDDSFIVLVTDERDGTATQTVTITIEPVNDPPVANDGSFNTPENTPVTDVIDVDDPDVATNSDDLTYSVITAPSHGSLDLDEDTGDFTYTPAANYNGADSFVVEVEDLAGETDQATIDLYINYYENDPEANDDYFTIDEDAADASFDVIDNDDDADLPYGDVIELYDISVAAAHGTASINSTSGEIEYTPDADYNGNDSFTYRIKDSQDPIVTGEAIVYVTIKPVNDVPVITSLNTVVVDEDNTLVGTVTFTDPDINDVPDADTHLFYTDAAPLHGKLNLNQFTGEYSYIPADDYNGSDSFTLRVTDSHDTSDSQEITVTVSSVDDDPVAKDDSYAIYQNSGWKTLDVVDNDTDADLDYGDILTIARILTEPANGTVQINTTTNTLSYKPDSGFKGTDTFEYEIEDTQTPGATDSATVTVKVRKASSSSGSSSGTYNYARNAARSSSGGSTGYDWVLLEDEEVKGSVITGGNSYLLDPNDPPKNGVVEVNPLTGEFTYTPNTDFNGEESFTILIRKDGKQQSQVIELVIVPVNDAPVVTNTFAAVNSGNEFTEKVPVEDIDVTTNADHLTYTVLVGAEHGEVILIPVTGEYIYRSNEGYVGEDTFTIRAKDQFGEYVDCVVTVDVKEKAGAVLRADGDKESSAGIPSGMRWPLLGLFFIILLPFIFNVRVTYMVAKPNGKFKKKTIHRSVIIGKKDEVIINLRDDRAGIQKVNETELLLRRIFVMHFKGRTLIVKRGGRMVKMVKVEANDNGRMLLKL